MPQVLNRHIDRIPKEAIYVGRGSEWGNPYRIGKDGSRDLVIRKFEKNVLPYLDVEDLRGHDLVCYCAPEDCHADLLLKEANK